MALSRIQRTFAYIIFFVGSGALVGSYGPAFHTLKARASINLAVFGDGISLNRLAKVLGTFAWRVERLSYCPHRVIVLGSALMAISAALFGMARGAAAVQISMLLGGLGTGFGGTGCSMLLQWSWAPESSRHARVASASAASAWTLGATIAPLILAALLPNIWLTCVIVACVLLTVVGMLSWLPSPPPATVAVPTKASISRDGGAPYMQQAQDDAEEGIRAQVGAASEGTRDTHAADGLCLVAEESEERAVLGSCRAETAALQVDGDNTATTAAMVAVEDAAADTLPSVAEGSAVGAAGVARYPAEQSEAVEVTKEWKPREVFAANEASDDWRSKLLTLVGGGFLLLCNATEHAVAVWLSEYGIVCCGWQEAHAAILTSHFFTAQLCTRLSWIGLAAHVPSAWPVLCASSLVCLGAAMALSSATSDDRVCSTALLELGTGLAGVGVGVGFPVVMSLPAEEGITVNAKMVTAISLTAYVGEMLGPWIVSRTFERSPASFGSLLAAWQVAALTVAVGGWVTIRRARR